MTVTPWYRSHAFWVMVVGTVAQILGGVFTENAQAEIGLFSGAAALVIGYLVTKGIVVKSVIQSGGPRVWGEGEGDEKKGEVEF